MKMDYLFKMYEYILTSTDFLHSDNENFKLKLG